jgi:predicted transcriptional regulator
MKTFTFRYDEAVATLKDLAENMSRSVKGKVPSIQSDHELRSGSIKTLLQVATENRINLFNSIRDQKPDSLYELAQLLEKDQAYVLREARILEGLGLISLERLEGEGRAKLKPTALYDRIVIDFGIGQSARVS